MSQPHENLVAWRRADDLCVAIHQLTHKRLPATERYELASQLRRAAYSVAANLAEGYASQSRRVRLRYARISIGSLAEVGYGIHLAERLGYLSGDIARQMHSQLAQTAAPLHGLIKHLAEEWPARKE
jgi:four helix bundle protein